MIATKAEFLELSRSGRLGNHPHYWDSPEAARRDGHAGTVALRYARRDSPYMRCDVPLDDVPGLIAGFARRGADPALFYLNEQEFEPARRILQGEAWHGPGGLYLNYSARPGGLRAALEADGRHVERLTAKMVLGHHLDPNSYDDLMDLMDRHDGAAVEFTAFDRPVGALPHRNTIIWEVRNY